MVLYGVKGQMIGAKWILKGFSHPQQLEFCAGPAGAVFGQLGDNPLRPGKDFLQGGEGEALRFLPPVWGGGCSSDTAPKELEALSTNCR